VSDNPERRGGDSLADRLHARLMRGGVDFEADLGEALLRSRARRLAIPREVVAEASANETLNVLCFAIGTERYAVRLDQLSEVKILGKWTPVPGQPQYLLGVTNLRGEIRPVLNLHSMLGLGEVSADQRFWVAFLRHDDIEIGLRIDRLERVWTVDSAALTLPHESGNGLPQRFIHGITADALIILDTHQIFALDVLKDPMGNVRQAS